MRCSRQAALTKSKLSGFAGCRFPPEVITLSVRWYLRYGLSYRATGQHGHVIDELITDGSKPDFGRCAG